MAELPCVTSLLIVASNALQTREIPLYRALYLYPGYAVTLQVIFGPLNLPYLNSFWQCLFFLFRCKFWLGSFCLRRGDDPLVMTLW